MILRVLRFRWLLPVCAAALLRGAVPVPPPPLVVSPLPEVSTAADGGLPPVFGVHNLQVFRANRTAPAHADGLAHTYLHAPMLAHAHGRLHLQYLSGPRNEHDHPTVTSLTSSADGVVWDAPRVAFPPFRLPDGTETVAHQRMGFHLAGNGRLLVLSYYGRAPSPNDGTGLGRAVREVRRDGSLGPLHLIRPGARPAFPGFTLPLPLYSTSSDAAFVAACEELLADRRVTAQWWEEDQLDDSGFYRVRGKALSFVTRPGGEVLGIWKNALVALTRDGGASWTEKQFAPGLPNNASKYWLQRTADGRFALVLNPTNRLRHPLAVLTSDNGAAFAGLWCLHGELPDQRFAGGFKNLGPQYVRGIAETNAVRSYPTSGDLWLAYSVNKEDIWVARAPVPLGVAAPGPVAENFDGEAPGSLPRTWNLYSPLWAPIRVIEAGGSAGRALELRDEDPYDYARAVRIFPRTHGVRIAFSVLARQPGARLEIELLDARGARPVRLAFEESGRLAACHEGQWMDAGAYEPGHWHRFELEIPANPAADRCAVSVDGRTPLARPAFFTDPVAAVERLSFRTGRYRERGYGGRDLPEADRRAPAAVFLVDDVTIVPLPPPPSP
jgi:hypothetical protein